MRHAHPRITLSSDRLAGELVYLNREDFHHLARSLRVRQGDVVDLGDGQGLTVRARVNAIFRDHMDLLVEEREFLSRARPSLSLFQGIAKGSKLDAVIRQNVELGADHITPFISGFTVPEGGMAAGNRLERLRKIAGEAAKQCRRVYAPEVLEVADMDAVLKELADFPVALVAWERGEKRAAEILPREAPDRLALIVGPEGGFSEHEVDELRLAGACTVTLGSNVLRTETAGLVLQAAVRCHYGLL